jgi:hypothetical protein
MPLPAVRVSCHRVTGSWQVNDQAARSDTTSAASTSCDGGSCSAGTPGPYRAAITHTNPASTGAAAQPPPRRLLPARPGQRHDQQTVTASLPLLLLDIDGVLNPFAAPACPPGYTQHDIFPGEKPVRLAIPRPRVMAAGTGHAFQLAWATAWGADANRLLAPLLQLPDLPVIAFPPVPFHPRDKLPAIITYAGHRPLAWIDDAAGISAIIDLRNHRERSHADLSGGEAGPDGWAKVTVLADEQRNVRRLGAAPFWYPQHPRAPRRPGTARPRRPSPRGAAARSSCYPHR